MVAFVITFCIFFVPRQLVDQEIISVVRVVRDPYILNGEPPEIELSKEKISLFYNLIKDLKYKKRYNIRRLKCKKMMLCTTPSFMIIILSNSENMVYGSALIMKNMEMVSKSGKCNQMVHSMRLINCFLKSESVQHKE